jgi:hypothetical protein
MNLPFSRASDFVSAHLQEAIKTHSVYDGSNRLIQFYAAIEQAKHGEQCALTNYTYDGASARVVGTKETLSTWDSAWDI